MDRRQVRNLAILVAIVVMCVSLVGWRSHAAQGQGAGDEDGAGVVQGEAPTAATPVPGGPGFTMQSAFAFRPWSSTAQWAFNSTALYNPGASGATYEGPLLLPHGATVTKFVVYYYDNATTNLEAYLHRCSVDTNTCSTLGAVLPTGASAAYRSAEDSTIVDAVVDNQSYSYSVEVYLPSSAGAAVSLLAVRVDYSYAAQLPLVMKER